MAVFCLSRQAENGQKRSPNAYKIRGDSSFTPVMARLNSSPRELEKLLICPNCWWATLPNRHSDAPMLGQT
ncbi:hypothetical protein D3C75_807360 [compost metagenome]